MPEGTPQDSSAVRRRGAAVAVAIVIVAFCAMVGLGALVTGSGSTADPPTGAIEAARVDRSLGTVSVRNLRVTFAQCGSEGRSRCSWGGVAVLAPHSLACPATLNGPLSIWEGRTGSRLIWNLESSKDGTVESGLIAVPSLGVEGDRLCLFASIRGPVKLGQAPPPRHLELVDSALAKP